MSRLDEAPEKPPALAGFAITYRRPETLLSTLRSILSQTMPPSSILVVDNDPEESARVVCDELAGGTTDVRYLPMGANVGPAGAAAKALEYLHREGKQWAYWIDDDDPPRYSDVLERLTALVQPDNVAAVGAVGQRWDWSTGHIRRLADSELVSGPVDVDYIAGGCQFLIRVSAAAEVGFPAAELFFGMEEPEFCLRLRAAGYRLIVDGELMRRHRVDAGRLGFSRKALRWPQVTPANLWREYYAIRNYIYFMRRTFDRPDLARRWAARGLLKASLGWRQGPSHGARATLLALRAIRDGYSGRMGRRVEPGR